MSSSAPAWQRSSVSAGTGRRIWRSSAWLISSGMYDDHIRLLLGNAGRRNERAAQEVGRGCGAFGWNVPITIVLRKDKFAATAACAQARSAGRTSRSTISWSTASSASGSGSLSAPLRINQWQMGMWLLKAIFRVQPLFLA